MFIVIEAIDGAGKGLQRNEISAYLAKKVKNLTTKDFPDHQSIIYQQLIHPALHEEIQLSKSAMFLAFALDQIMWQDKILPTLGSKTDYFIADGYFTTNLVYQCLMAKNFELDDAIKFATTFGIAVPDLIIYLDVDPEVAMERKMKEEGHDEGLDIYERSLQKQQQIRAGFKQMVKNQTFGKWTEVDGMGSITEVTQNIIAALNKLQII